MGTKYIIDVGKGTTLGELADFPARVFVEALMAEMKGWLPRDVYSGLKMGRVRGTAFVSGSLFSRSDIEVKFECLVYYLEQGKMTVRVSLQNPMGYSPERAFVLGLSDSIGVAAKTVSEFVESSLQ